jgi:hypothetical protein
MSEVKITNWDEQASRSPFMQRETCRSHMGYSYQLAEKPECSCSCFVQVCADVFKYDGKLTRGGFYKERKGKKDQEEETD